MVERPPDESGDSRPALRIGSEAGIGAVAEEGRDGDVGEADLGA